MKKILLFLFLTLAVILPATAADNFADTITIADLGIEQGATAQVTYVANPSGTEYVFKARHYYASRTNQIMVRYDEETKGGILITKTYGRLAKITLDWMSINKVYCYEVYGSDTPYSTDMGALYESDANLGTLLVSCFNTNGKKGVKEYVIENPTEFKYYALRLSSSSDDDTVMSISCKSMTFEYEPGVHEACGPISISLADGTAVTGNDVVIPEPMELLISCATEGASIAYDLDGTVGTLTDGRLRVERGGTLALTATKDGFEPSERTISFTIPVKPIEINAGGAVIVSDLLRAYGKTAVTLSTATPGAAITWEYDGKTGTSTDLEVEVAGTLKVTAVKDGFTTATRTVEVRPFAPLTSIQAVWDAYPVPGNGTVTDPEPLTVLFDATVVYVANAPDMYSDVPNGQVYITDGTNFSRIFFAGTPVDYKPGDVIAKGWTAKFQRHGGWKEFVPESGLTVASHDGKVPAPRAIGDEDALQALDPGTPVVVKGVILACATSSEIYTGDQPSLQIKTTNSPVALINAFGIASVDSARYDVYGLVDFYGYKRSNAPAVGPTDGDYSHRQWRVAVTEFELWKPTSPRPQFALTNDSEVDSGEPIVITCQDEAATIMYSMDGENYSEYDAANPPVMPAEDVIVSAYSRQEGYHDSAVRRVSLRYSGKAGIADITLDPAGAAEYYDLTGRRVDSPKAGMYIRVQGGRATKVIL